MSYEERPTVSGLLYNIMKKMTAAYWCR